MTVSKAATRPGVFKSNFTYKSYIYHSPNTLRLVKLLTFIYGVI
jgi:hypothetical protein